MKILSTLKVATIALSLFTINVSAEDLPEGQEISVDSFNTVEKFGWGDLNPVNWGKSLEHDAEKIGKGIAKAAEKGLKILESLAEPCKACKEGLHAGIDAFACGKAANAIAKQVEECSAKVSEEEPELAPESPAICGALKTAVEVACKRTLKKSEDLQSFETKIVDHACHAAHLCH
jgi:hypothetical protein